MSKRDVLGDFVVLRVVVRALVGALVVIVPPAHAQGPIVDPDVKVNDSKGRDGADTSPACCWDPDPGAPACDGAEWAFCCYHRARACLNGSNHMGTCIDDNDCPGGGTCVACDDEPKRQAEMAIVAAPWDSNVLLAAWMDGARQFEGSGYVSMMGVGISDDAGATWRRFDRALDPCDLSCDPASDCFVPGSSLVADDLCFDWGDSQGDPGAAATAGYPGDPDRRRFFYLAGLDQPNEPFFARLEWVNPMTGWELARVPAVGDKPYITADPTGEDVYVYSSGVFLSASRTAGDDFLSPPPLIDGLDLAIAGGFNGVAPVAAMGPDQDFNIVWGHLGGGVAVPGNEHPGDQIRYRRGTWDENNNPPTLEFLPPLPDPPSTECAEGVDCAQWIVFGHDGFDAGFGSIYGNTLVKNSTNIGGLGTFPSIAVDRNVPDDVCARGGTVYVAYVAHEWPGNCTGCANPAVCTPEVLNRPVDSNIYVARGRVLTIDNETVVEWSSPVNILEDVPDPDPVLCDLTHPNLAVACGMHSPFQLFPWIAVDAEGRVGVMFYDTTTDNDRCDANTIFQIKFSYSLDGGVTWEVPVTVSQEASESSPPDPILQNPVPSFRLGEYYGLTGASDGTGNAFFHPIWADLRGWEGEPLLFSNLTFGDAYTARVTLPAGLGVISMGDQDGDGNVDADDYGRLLACIALTESDCEDFDFNRDGEVTEDDKVDFCTCASAGAAPFCDTCTATVDCADADTNGVRDDVCLWWECVGNCVGTSTAFPSDMGGAFGACVPDGFCNIHDRNLALDCFAGKSPCDSINIDAGGSFLACPPDGFCNIHDANHAMACFNGTNPCTCGESPMGSGPPEVVGSTSLSVVADPLTASGDTVTVRVFTDEPLEDLQSYQLELAVSGGTSGQLELIHITIEPRSDYVFAGREDNFTAFNLTTGQMLSGIDIDAGVETAPHAYLGTYTYRRTATSAGTFVVSILHDEANGDQTFLGASFGKKIEVVWTTPGITGTTP